MPPPLLRGLALHGFALALAGVMLAIITTSAWLRLAQAPEVCPWWPSCRQQSRSSVAADGIARLPPPGQAVRIVHRVAASLSLPLVLAILVTAFVRERRERHTLGIALLLLVLTAGLALLGVLAGGSHALPVVLANLLGGFAMLAGAYCLVVPAAGASAARETVRDARLALTAWLLQIVLGVWAGNAIPNSAGWLHLVWALVALGAAGRLARGLRRTRRRHVGSALLTLVTAQWVSGGVAAVSSLPPWLLVIHGLCAALILAVFASLSWPRGEATAHWPSGNGRTGLPGP